MVVKYNIYSEFKDGLIYFYCIGADDSGLHKSIYNLTYTTEEIYPGTTPLPLASVPYNSDTKGLLESLAQELSRLGLMSDRIPAMELSLAEKEAELKATKAHLEDMRAFCEKLIQLLIYKEETRAEQREFQQMVIKSALDAKKHTD